MQRKHLKPRVTPRDKAIMSYRQDLVNESIGSGPEAEQSLLLGKTNIQASSVQFR